MIVRHMYEGFEQAPLLQNEPTPQQAAQPPNVNMMLRNLEQLIGTPGHVPDARPTMPMEATEQRYDANTGREQPRESDGQSSKPQPVDERMETSQALEQGKAFQQTKPQAVKEIIKERIVEVPRACPPPKECPVCPDMRNYIRKDSIPCWACKL
jgi:hypothetical protein